MARGQRQVARAIDLQLVLYQPARHHRHAHVGRGTAQQRTLGDERQHAGAGNAARCAYLVIDNLAIDTGVAGSLLFGETERQFKDGVLSENLLAALGGPRAGYQASMGSISFSSIDNAGDMRSVANFVAGLPSYFQSTIAAAGPITVTFGRAPGGGVGCWDPGSRSIILNPNHRHVQAAGTNRLLGAAAFEMINAAGERARLDIESTASNGVFERQAPGSGYTPAQLYGREMERLEFRNGQFHRQMMTEAGFGNTRANLFDGETRDFETYYAQQVAAGHTRSYEDHYNFLRPGPVVIPPGYYYRAPADGY